MSNFNWSFFKMLTFISFIGKLQRFISYQVYDVGESLAVPNNDDWNKFAHTLADIKQNKIEQEDWDKIGGSLNPSGASGVGVGGTSSYMSGVAPLGIVPGGSGPSSLTSLTSMSSSPLR